jgi:hypothetical protein
VEAMCVVLLGVAGMANLSNYLAYINDD